jgi:hypothetical protein
MRLLLTTARWEFIILVTAYAVVTLWKLFQSQSFAGLIRASDGSLSPGRIQLLTLTILTALQYLLTTLHDPSRLHALPPGVVAVMGGSQTLYLGAKAWTIFGRQRNDSEE